jgi:UDP:flavonoid glycosyltransferase YjiC (YdhE family)
VARFLFVPYSVAGHVHPMLPVMAELVGRGHQVRALVGSGFAARVRAVGAEAAVLAAVADVYVPDRLTARAVRRFVLGRVHRVTIHRRAARTLAVELARRPPDVVVLDPMIGWAHRAADRSTGRAVVFSTTFASTSDAGAVLARRYGPRWAAGGQRFRPFVRRHRLPLLVHALPELQPAANLLDRRTHLLGPLVRPVPGDARARGPSRLLVSFGTVFARGAAVFREVADAFAGSDWAVLLATGHTDPDALGPLPPNVTARRWVDQRTALAGSAVFLTHAGMNSAMEALVAGVPMVFLPRSREQRFIADGLSALGVGRALDRARIVETVTAVAGDQRVLAAVESWRVRLAAAPGARRAADVLEAEARAFGCRGRGAPPR